MEIYVIKDLKADSYHTPFFQPTDVHALRAFRTEVNRVHEHNTIYLYPEEFDLVHLGTFVEKQGFLNGSTAKGRLTNGATLKAPKD